MSSLLVCTSASLIIPKFLRLKQAAFFVMFYFYKHVTVKQAKYWYVTRNVQGLLIYYT